MTRDKWVYVGTFVSLLLAFGIFYIGLIYEANVREGMKADCIADICNQTNCSHFTSEKLDQFGYECADSKRGFRSDTRL
jgi:hypothetical protein